MRMSLLMWGSGAKIDTIWQTVRFPLYQGALFAEFHVEAKYHVPRDPSLRSCYRASKLQRPRLKIHGAWCFNYTLQLAILEDITYHGSAMVQEVLMRTLEEVISQCKANHQPYPDTVVVVGDNTVKELKNSTRLCYLASLVNHGRLRFLAFEMCLPEVLSCCFELCNDSCLPWCFHPLCCLSKVCMCNDVACFPHPRCHWLLGID